MRQVLSIFLVIILLTSNVGINLATHFCGGKAVKTALLIGNDNLSCGMADKEVSSCENHTKTSSVLKTNCCNNQFIQLSVDDEFTSQTAIQAPLDFTITAVLIGVYQHIYSFTPLKVIDYLNASPPLLNLNIQVLFQTFLI